MSVEWNIAFGKSCTNCIHCIEVNKHPQNTGEAKGKISEPFGLVCLMPICDDMKIKGKALFFNHGPIGCEMWERKIEGEKIFEKQNSLKEHEIRDLINEIRDGLQKLIPHQCLREVIAKSVKKFLFKNNLIKKDDNNV